MTRIHEPSFPSSYPIWLANDPEGPKIAGLATMMPSRRDPEDTRRKVHAVAGAVYNGYISVTEVARRLEVSVIDVEAASAAYAQLYALAPHAGEDDSSTGKHPADPDSESVGKPGVPTGKIDRYRNRSHAKHSGAGEVDGTV